MISSNLDISSCHHTDSGVRNPSFGWYLSNSGVQSWTYRIKSLRTKYKTSNNIRALYGWPMECTGHWKANRANRFIGRVHDHRISPRNFPAEFLQHVQTSWTTKPSHIFHIEGKFLTQGNLDHKTKKIIYKTENASKNASENQAKTQAKSI